MNHIICLKSVCLSGKVRRLQVAILARSPREMSQTDRILPRYFLSRVRVSVRPRFFVIRKNIGAIVYFNCNRSAIRLFANDVIMSGSVRADWPAPFSVIIGNPRADNLGRNGFECIGRRCLVDRERCVRATFMHSAIENYSMLHLQRWLECRGIKRFGTKSRFMITSHNCQSCMCRQ